MTGLARVSKCVCALGVAQDSKRRLTLPAVRGVEHSHFHRWRALCRRPSRCLCPLPCLDVPSSTQQLPRHPAAPLWHPSSRSPTPRCKVHSDGGHCCFPSAFELGSAARPYPPKPMLGGYVYVRAHPILREQDADGDPGENRIRVCELSHNARLCTASPRLNAKGRQASLREGQLASYTDWL